MIGRKSQREDPEEVVETSPKGFDDYELTLGDIMRGERATMGKSLLDVQRELRIKATYIAAIENADPSVFETQGFIAGFVRSYARYLGLDPEESFSKFCAESGFVPMHGMTATSGPTRSSDPAKRRAEEGLDPLVAPNLPFIPERESFFSGIEPRAIGSALVLVALIGGIGFGGWSVLNEVQRVQLAPVDQTPVVLSDLDPLEGAMNAPAGGSTVDVPQFAGLVAPSQDEQALDRLYRPQALDVPVLAARDAPISTLNPASVGVFTPEIDLATASPETALPGDPAPVPQVVEAAATEIALIATRPAWVRVRAADGSVIFEKILDAGEEYILPATEEPPTLRAGMSGSIYFRIGDAVHGPAGQGTGTVRDVALSIDSLSESYAVADLEADAELARIVAEAVPVADPAAPRD